jgi:DHA2 family methylenomycin A resistance protein-like MFS transporter
MRLFMPVNNRKWLILLATGLIVSLVNIDMTIVNLALASISSSFHATMNQTQWIITSYLMSTAISFTLIGRLADHFGRKKIFLLGVLIFTVSSFGCGISPDINYLLFWRFLQGVGFAATLGLSFVIIFANFPQKQQGLAVGIAVTVSGLSQALGPTIGGVIIEHMSWPWIFWVNIPFGLLSVFLSARYIPADTLLHPWDNFNLENVLYYIVGLGLALYLFNQIDQLSLWWTVSVFVLASILIMRFIQTTHKLRNPLIELYLITNRDFLILILLRFIFMIFFSSSLFIIPLLMQNILCFSATKTGVSMLAITLFVATVSPITGRFIDKTGYIIPLLLSMILCFLASICMQIISAEISLVLLLVTLVPLGIAVGIHVPSSISGVNTMLSGKSAAAAMGVFFTMAISGATIGVGLTGALLNTLSKRYLESHLGNEELSNALLLTASGARSILILPDAYKSMSKMAFFHAFHVIAIWLSILLFLALVMFCKYLTERVIVLAQPNPNV